MQTLAFHDQKQAATTNKQVSERSCHDQCLHVLLCLFLTATDEDLQLLTADSPALRLDHLATATYTILVSGSQVGGVVGVDFHYQKRYIYWTDNRKKQINR